ncbi:hypothetical protein EDB81DRAFT_320941 [Dactylonectria macrodidyma]|uniref:Uncharacterized protein n=1 Tax=Dactylonectria macrodidyma TaxID=307937 RepID=A0A9P9JGJ4_9HYPO|nr:hypothetical protein EDB81DRAFT_320941 [Dactylonectria macrodidyma]
MCRMVVFAGTCSRCGDAQTWTDLTQELSCLEAKNKGCFGECSRGILVEEHDFDQECQTCAEEDEGIGDLDDGLLAGDDQDTAFTQGTKRNVADEQESASTERKKQKT